MWRLLLALGLVVAGTTSSSSSSSSQVNQNLLTAHTCIKDTQAGSGPVRISRVSPKMGERRDFSLTQARLSCSVCHETRAQLGITFLLLEPHFFFLD